MTPKKPKPHLGQGPWTDLQLLLRALRDAGPDAAKEGLTALAAPEAGVTVEGVTMVLAWPDMRLGVVQSPAPTPPEGWQLVGFDPISLASVGESLGGLVLAARLARVNSSAELSTSKGEDALIGELMKRGLPMPDRNYKVVGVDGEKIASVPDAVWEQARVAVYYDGSYFHTEKSTSDLLASLAEDNSYRNAEAAKRKDKVAKDHRHRRRIQAAGWTVITVVDVDWHDQAMRPEILDHIVTAYHAGIEAAR